MAVAIRLQRHGAKKHPFYRIVAIDSRKRRDGKYIEALGYYRPTRPNPNVPALHLEPARLAHWVEHGAQLSPKAAWLYKQYLKHGGHLPHGSHLPAETEGTAQGTNSVPAADATSQVEAAEIEKGDAVKDLNTGSSEKDA